MNEEIARSAQAGRILKLKSDGDGVGDGLEDIVRQARKDFQAAVDHDRLNRDEALADMKFLGGEQWDLRIRQEREAANRPCLTINQLKQYVRQVVGDIRSAQPAIKVRPVADGADEELAEVLAGIVRHVEQTSSASTVYIHGAECAASCGMGYWRLDTFYPDDASFDLEPCIRRIMNPFSVHFDPAAVEHTREDARFCFVVEWLPRQEFEARYPKASFTGWDNESRADYLQNWWNADTVRVAEYWVKVPTKRKLAQLQDGTTLDITDMDDDALEGMGQPVVKEREFNSFKVVQYVLNGSEVLEGPTDWPGRYIPIIPVWGEEVQVAERTIRHGVVRFAKDAQQMYNYSRSAATEMIALAPKAPFIGTQEQFKGHERLWRRANTDNLPYLTYSPSSQGGTLLPAPARVEPPPVQAALHGEIEIARMDMQSTTGIYNASLGAKSNEVSGKAIETRDRMADIGSNVYSDNINKAIAYTGKQLIDLIPRVYDTTRMVRILGEDEDTDFVHLNYPIIGDDGQPAYATALKDKKTGEMKMLPDLSAGRFDVVVSTGPSYATKRQEAAESMMNFIQAFPQAAPLIGDLVAKSMDWPGHEAIAERLATMLPPQLQKDENGQPPPAPPPDPLHEAEVAKAQAETAKTGAQADGEKVKTDGLKLDNMLKEMQLGQGMAQLQQMVQQGVAQALQQILGVQMQLGPAPGMQPQGMGQPPGPPQPMPGAMPPGMPQGAPPGVPVQ